MKTPTWERSTGALLEHIVSNRRTTIEHLFTTRLHAAACRQFGLAEGTVIRWTDGPADAVVNGKTFRAPCPTQGHAAVWAPATFGRTTAGNYPGSWGTMNLSASRFALPRDGQVRRLKFLVTENKADVRVTGYIFAAGGYDSQSAYLSSILVAKSAELVGVTGSQVAPEWHSLEFASPIDLPAGDYDLGLFASSMIATLDYSSGLYWNWGGLVYPSPISVGDAFGWAVPTLRERAIYAEYEYLTTEE